MCHLLAACLARLQIQPQLGSPKSARAERCEGKHRLSSVCVSRMKSNMDSCRAEFTAQPSFHVVSASSPFFTGLVGT